MGAEKKMTASAISRMSIRTDSPFRPVSALSGGTQQKVVIGKGLIQKPKIVIFDEPTRGVDVGAIAEIHQLINRLADEGLAVIVISSIGGLRGSPQLGAYAISKAADMQLARNIAVEWGPKNIRANAIAPGLVRTDFARALWENPVLYRKRTKDTRLQRIGEPDEIAGASVFLASAAGSFVTGQTIVIDGGTTAGAVVSHDD